MTSPVELSPSGERTLRVRYRACEVPWSRDKSIDDVVRFTLDGQIWQADVARRSGHGGGLDVYLSPDKMTGPLTITYGVRLISDGVVVVDRRPELFHYDVGAKYPDFYNLVMWNDLRIIYCTGGCFTLEFVFPSIESPYRAMMPMTLASAVFKDIKIACEGDDDGVECNKCIVARESKVIRTAFEKETSTESVEKKFIIKHKSATTYNVRLLIRAMYEGWAPECMNAHAKELLLLADAYDCPTIAAHAIEALKRELADGKFWSIVQVAAQLKDPHNALIRACAHYAHPNSGRFHELLALKEDFTIEMLHALMVGVGDVYKFQQKP